jgi:two-component system nitrogen regulation response regulator NtrX
MKKHRILIVDDEPSILEAFSSLLGDEGYQTLSADSSEEASRKLSREDVDLILLDLQLPGLPGLEFFRNLRQQPWAPAVLVVSGQADIAAALEAVRLGAVDFLEKPVQPEKLISSVAAALALAAADRQRNLLVEEIDERCRIVGESIAIKNLIAAVDRMAPTDATVLITGENGTGKELIATRLYLQSRRRTAPYLKVNCPGIPEALFESELFGHVKGAFTGAVRDHPGKFATADGGTLFLDEIGDLPLPCQAKLLRVLETGEVETLGRDEFREVDVRIICATNRNLPEAISAGRFREDLFYRISVLTVEAPPLSARVEDIPLLTGLFLQKYDPAGNIRLSPAAMAYLQAQTYPGNVRQLRNLVERLTILSPRGTLDEADMKAVFAGGRPVTSTDDSERPLAERVAQFEHDLIKSTLAECDGNISEAARRLKVDRANLSRKVKELNLRTSEQ